MVEGPRQTGPQLKTTLSGQRRTVTNWQSQAKSEIATLLKVLGDTVTFESVEVRENPALDHQAGDVYLTTTVNRGEHRYKIYIYSDEAGVDVNGTWRPFELPDWNNDPKELLDGFAGFLRETLRGKCE